LKRSETKVVRVDRLSGIMPDPSRLSAVSRSPLVSAGGRWLSFARGLARGRTRRMSAADTLAFIESLYGGMFTAVEGGAFSFDKVYRTSGGGRFVSETRLGVSVHPRFDLRVLHFAGSQVSREAPSTTLLSHAGAGGRERQRAAWQIMQGGATTPSLTVQTWNVFPAGGESHLPAFGYVSVRGRRGQQAREATLPSARGNVTTGASVETSRQTDAAAPTSLPLTSLNLMRPVTHVTRQEFVSLLLNTYLPAAVSREVLSVKTARELSSAPPGRAATHGAAEWRPKAWAYAGPVPRHAPGAEIRRESRSFETLKEHASAGHAPPAMIHVLPPASLLTSLSETFLTVLTGAAGHTTHHSGGSAPAPSLHLLRAHAAPSGTRAWSAAVDASRLLGQTPPGQTTVTRNVLSSLNTFAERVHTNVAGFKQAGRPPFFTRPGFEQVSSRRGGTSSVSAPSHVTARVLFGRPGEFVRPASVVESMREAPMYDAGAGTFLFATRLLRSSAGASTNDSLSPTAATGRAVKETRAARPEGMALELIRQRRQEVLQLPSPGYVFTQPSRAQLEERQVITKASREEIVEVVRKEVRALTASAPASPAPSRAELAGIADEVYSTLVRRLLVEKERLGRF
jgi:hypothetical protein